jgi:glycosyltransferase involved in cell wall biosynthesis
MSEAGVGMRILTVVINLEKGGTQRVAQVFAEAYAGLGHDSRVLAVAAEGPRARELEAAKVVVWDGRDPGSIQRCAAWKPDIIHLHSLGLDSSFVTALLTSCKSKSVVETNVFSAPSPWEAQLDLSFQLGTWCEWLYLRRGGDPRKTVVVPNPVNDRAFFRASCEEAAAFREKFGVGSDEVLILRIGQAYPGKWSPLLLDAFSELVSGGIPATLMLVNAPPELLGIVERSRHRERVRVIDRIIGDDGLRTAYTAADVFAHVADQGESFGLVLAEAMLCNTPVVTMSTPWEDNTQPEVVGNMKGGLVATSREGFITALRTLATDPSLRQKLGEGARARVLEHFGASSVAKRALTLSEAFARPRTGNSEITPRCAGRAEIASIYEDAFDPPSAILRASVGRLTRLQLPRYLSGYQPWSRMAQAAARAFGARLGLCERLSRW